MKARFEHTVDDADAVRRGSAALYCVLVAAFAVGGLFRRELLVVAAVFVVVLVVWGRSVRRAMPTRPWVLEIDADRITVDRNGEVTSVARGAATDARLVRRRSRGAAWWELRVTGAGCEPLLREGVRDDQRVAVEAALRTSGWSRR